MFLSKLKYTYYLRNFSNFEEYAKLYAYVNIVKTVTNLLVSCYQGCNFIGFFMILNWLRKRKSFSTVFLPSSPPKVFVGKGYLKV